jgi:triosephosphate isomerase
MKYPILAANWKMYKTRKEAREFCQALVQDVPARHLQHVILAPPFTSLDAVVEAVSSSSILVAAQNCHWEVTGEISHRMLTDLGVGWTILGHSERRHVFGESEDMIAKRLEGALKQGMKVIFCVGETLADRKAGRTEDVLGGQLAPLAKFMEIWQNMVIAYEPVWAIGTGVVASTDQIDQAHAFIHRSYPNLPILYGGSVNPDNIGEIMGLERVWGALIGGASLDAGKFKTMLAMALQVKGVQ